MTGDEQIIATPMLTLEAHNVFWLSVHRGLIPKDHAFKLAYTLKTFLSEGVIMIENLEPYLNIGLEIAIRQSHSFYDSLGIAQAQVLNASMITADVRQAEIARAEHVTCTII